MPCYFFIGIIDSMQTHKNLKRTLQQKDDAPVTQKDLRSLHVQLSDISDKLEKMRREQKAHPKNKFAVQTFENQSLERDPRTLVLRNGAG